jgi:hypothetical protein
VFSVDLPLDVPGAVIQPGTYVLRLKREPGKAGGLAQLQLWDAAETTVLAEFPAVQSYDPASADNSIMTYYEGASGRRVLKAWNLLTTHYSERIVYPPPQATELAKLTNENVLSMPLPGAPAVSASTQPAEAQLIARASPPESARLPAKYPKTAGNVPLVLWIGFTALAAFIVFRIYRSDPALDQNARNNAAARKTAAAAYRTYKSAGGVPGKVA